MNMYVSFLFKIISCLTLILINQPQSKSLEFSFPEFNKEDEARLILSGESNTNLGAIQVTPDARGATLVNFYGRAVYKDKFSLWSRRKSDTSVSSFNTTFEINIQNQTSPGGEGFAFIITDDPHAPENSQGQWLGIVNQKTNGTARIVAVEFDTRKSFNSNDIDGNHVGLDVKSISSRIQVPLSNYGIDIQSGVSLTVRVLYDTKNLSCYVSRNVSVEPVENVKNLVFSEAINLHDYLSQSVYVGFSGSTSNYTELNCVKSWNFTSIEVEKHPNGVPNWVWILVLCLAVVLLLALAAVCFVCLRRRFKRQNLDPDGIENRLDHCTLNPRKFKFSELKKATGNFNPKRKLGKGGFGTVYKGTWKEKDVAVKRISKRSHQGKQEFIAEVTTIGNLNHRNLVKLIGWCYERHELLIVYECVPNGSLDKYLFVNEKSSEVKENLMWDTRLNIIVGVAQALEYLHNGCERRILHRDVKASNVMLDLEFNAKLGDFGLARTLERSEMTHHSTNEIAGTPGYMAPETFLNGRATVETDVYAFGILVLEVVTGRKPGNIHESDSYSNNIVNWLWELYRKGLVLEAADPRLNEEYMADEMKCVLVLGLACCHPNPHQRPSMKTVLKVLLGEANPPEIPEERPAFVWPAMPVSFSDLDYSINSSQSTQFTVITGR